MSKEISRNVPLSKGNKRILRNLLKLIKRKEKEEEMDINNVYDDISDEVPNDLRPKVSGTQVKQISNRRSR